MNAIQVWSRDIKLSNQTDDTEFVGGVFVADGEKVVVGFGNEILVLDALTGKPNYKLKGHSDKVSCICQLPNGGFASGGNDKQVIVWTKEFKKVLKYSHTEPVVSIAANHITGEILSCTSGDFGIWHRERNQVPKHKVSARILTSDWNNDGTQFAIGLENGTISTRTSDGRELYTMNTGENSVIAIRWVFQSSSNVRVLAVLNSFGKLSFIEPNTQKTVSVCQVPYEPLFVELFTDKDLVIVAGVRDCCIYSVEGFMISRIGLGMLDGSISCLHLDTNLNLCLGTNNGNISVSKLTPTIIMDYHNPLYAFSHNFANITVQDLNSSHSFEINCFKAIQQISLKDDGIVVKIDGVVIYFERISVRDSPICFKLKSTILVEEEVSALKLHQSGILIASKNMLKKYSLDGKLLKTRNFESLIIGLDMFAKGVYVRLFNAIELIDFELESTGNAIALSVDISKMLVNEAGTALLVKDDKNNLHLYTIATKMLKLLLNSVDTFEFHETDPDVYCMCSQGIIYVYRGNERIFQTDFKGEIMAFYDSTVLMSQNQVLSKIPIPGFMPKPQVTEVFISLTKNDPSWLLNCSKAFVKAGQYKRAIQILHQGGLLNEILKISKLQESDPNLLEYCSSLLQDHPDLVLKLQKQSRNTLRLLELCIQTEKWQDAYRIALPIPQLHKKLFEGHAVWLFRNAKYEEAVDCYLKCGEIGEACKVHVFRAENAAAQYQFKPASFHYWSASSLLLNNINTVHNGIEKANTYFQLTRLYYCYEIIHSFVEDPFTLASAEKLLNNSRYALHYLLNNPKPTGISLIYVLYCAARVSYKLGCFKFCKYVYSLLQLQKVPLKLKIGIEQGGLMVHAKPDQDDPELFPHCYRCSSRNPFFQSQAQCCIVCNEPFVYSLHSFANLGLVEFQVENGIAATEFEFMIGKEPTSELEWTSSSPQVFGRNELLQCDKNRVFVVDWKNPDIPTRYYLALPDAYIVKCKCCNSFYTEQEWNYFILIDGKCPLCKTKGTISN